MKDEVIFRYTIRDAEEDGVLVNVLLFWKGSPISHVTSNLLSHGYYEQGGGDLRIPNLIDLLAQAVMQIRKKSPGRLEYFYVLRIEFPDGERRKVFAIRNELDRLTLMMPEDY